MNSFKICEKRKDILESNDHMLVEGGPGSGKTTIALLKADKIITDGLLKPNQKILFLSFARATISRVEEQTRQLIKRDHKKSLEINTYHGFAWDLINTYGYLLHRHSRFQLITPPHLSAKAADINKDNLKEFKVNLLKNDGIICFDLFAETASTILERSETIRSIISGAYPFIIVDEFQDTDNYEWKLIRALGQKSIIIALADLDQRIYEFRGASIKRIPEFNLHFKALKFDLGKENNRSANTDIVAFGDDVLTGANKSKQYDFVKVVKYRFYQGDMSRISLKTTLLGSISRLTKSTPDRSWSIAVLVATKKDTLSVSTYLSAIGIAHDVLIDPAGPSLAASLIASMLEPCGNMNERTLKLLAKLIDHIKGRKGDKPTKDDLALAKALESFISTGEVRGPKRKAIVNEVISMAEKLIEMQLTGVPGYDWLSVRKQFELACSECLKNVFDDARYLKLLHRGALLSERLAEMWRTNRNYLNAASAVEAALTQEHFSMATREWRGVFVMNIHKSKGKEFDEVIVWEEYRKPIVHPNSSKNPNSVDQGRLLIRVAATRARLLTTFLTPASDPCILL